MRWRERDGVRWLEADLDGAGVAFPARVGGVSEPPRHSLNLGLLTGDDPAAVVENRRRLAAAIGVEPGRVALARQVHGAELLEHAQGAGRWLDPDPGAPQADGHLLREAGQAAFCFTADCLPVALCGPGGVALLHCGWRGLAAGIVARGAAAVGARAAVVGPGIGPCCYEVGEEVAAEFADLDGAVARRPGAARPRLDLVAAARALLAAAGVERVAAAGLCTGCEAELFFSHRRDRGATGRGGALAWLGPRGGGGEG